MDGVGVAEIPGKGRGLVAARPLRGGEVVLRDSPILLYAAGDDSSGHCGECFRSIQEGEQHQCGATHSAWGRDYLSLLRRRSASLSAEQVVQARFLIAAYEVRRKSAAQFSSMMQLQGSADARSDGAARAIHGALGLEEEEEAVSSALLAKERVNAFGLMEAPAAESGERRVRAYGIYLKASALNHDCLPNACRFEWLELGTEMSVRMIHDVAEGAEVCLSYFPVNLGLRARRDRLVEEYGFTCACDRCKVEEEWPEEEDDIDLDQDLDLDLEDEDDDHADDKDDDLNDDEGSSSFPHAYFFGRYMCQLPNCGGTLAPLAPTALLTMECNVCSHLTSLQH